MYRVPDRPLRLGSYRWRTVLVGLTMMVLFSEYATYEISSYYRFAPALGVPLTTVANIPIYEPFACLFWLWWIPIDTTVSIYGATAIIGIFAVVVVAGISNARSRRSLNDNVDALHGSAKWATFEDVKSAGLLAGEGGVYVGGCIDPHNNYQHYLQHNGPEHVLVIAPTRSGKGASLVIPTLLAWTESAIIYDIKGENWEKTSGFRAQQGQICFRFSPTDPTSSSRFNPLAEIRLHTSRDVSDAQNIAEMMTQTGEQQLAANRYFYEAANSIIVGMILYTCYKYDETGRVACLADVGNEFTVPGRSLPDLLKKLVKSKHPVVRKKAQIMLSKHEENFSAVESTTQTAFDLFDDPMVAQCTSASDFRVADLMDHERPISLYLIVPPGDIDRLRPLMRMLFTVIINRLTQSLDGTRIEHRHRLLLMIDEFPTLKRLDLFSTVLSYLAGYGIKVYLIAHDIRQIADAYGSHESIVSNCHIRIAFAPNHPETAELLSRMTGQRTIPRPSVSFSGASTSPILSHASTAIVVEQRPLFTADEVSRIPAARKEGRQAQQRIVAPGNMLIFVAGCYPIYGVQMFYFREFDAVLGARAGIPPPTSLPTIDGDGKVNQQAPIGRTANVISAVEVVPAAAAVIDVVAVPSIPEKRPVMNSLALFDDPESLLHPDDPGPEKE